MKAKTRAYERRLVHTFLLLVHDRDIRVVNATTGDLIRELVLDPSRDYQPRHDRPDPETHKAPNP
jgi:hypothetical protein